MPTQASSNAASNSSRGVMQQYIGSSVCCAVVRISYEQCSLPRNRQSKGGGKLNRKQGGSKRVLARRQIVASSSEAPVQFNFSPRG